MKGEIDLHKQLSFVWDEAHSVDGCQVNSRSTAIVLPYRAVACDVTGGVASLNLDATELKIFYGNLRRGVATRHRTPYEPNFEHFYKISDKSQNVHTADLGYLGFQDYH